MLRLTSYMGRGDTSGSLPQNHGASKRAEADFLSDFGLEFM